MDTEEIVKSLKELANFYEVCEIRKLIGYRTNTGQRAGSGYRDNRYGLRRKGVGIDARLLSPKENERSGMPSEALGKPSRESNGPVYMEAVN